MSYIKFIGEDVKYKANIMPYKTQHGKQAIRIISEPLEPREVGFRLYSDKDEMIADYIDYRYHYKDNAYTMEPDYFEPGGPGNGPLKPNMVTRLESELARVSSISYQTASEVTKLEPYTDSKTAYIDDTEVIFDCDKTGSISAWLISDGVRSECQYEVSEGKIIVYFEPLEVVSEVFIQIQ